MAREERALARPRRRRYRGAVRHDGWPRGRDPHRARCQRFRDDADHGLRGQVRLRVLRTLPRSRRFRATIRRPAQLPDGPGQRPRGHARNRARSRRGRRHDHGEASHAVSRLDLPGAPAIRRADRRVPGERRVFDDRGRGSQWVDRLRPGDDGEPDIDRACRRGYGLDVFRQTGRKVARARAARSPPAPSRFAIFSRRRNRPNSSATRSGERGIPERRRPYLHCACACDQELRRVLAAWQCRPGRSPVSSPPAPPATPYAARSV